MIDGGLTLEMVERKHFYVPAFGKFVSTCIGIVLIIMEKFIMVVGGKNTFFHWSDVFSIDEICSLLKVIFS